MKALYYQPSCGIAGDMHLAALVSLGLPEAYLADMLAKLPVHDEFTMTFTPASKMGISGLQTQIAIQDQADHRHHSTIVQMIEEAGLPTGVAQRALAMFSLIADAEGKIHNVPAEKVHFHEVGAMDSIIDIVGAAAAIEYFKPDIVLCDWTPDLDGIEFIRRIRLDDESVNPYVPIVVVTANTELRHVCIARNNGMTEFLAKPVSAKTIYSRLCSVIENPRPFIRVNDFFGPDRRRRSFAFNGEDRRRAV